MGASVHRLSFPEFDVNVLEAILTVQRFSIWPETEKFSKNIHCSLHMQECRFEFDTSYRNDLTIQVHFSNNQVVNRILVGWRGVRLTCLDCKKRGSWTLLDFKIIHKHVAEISAAHSALRSVRCPLIYSFPLVKVVVVDCTLLSIIKKLWYQLMI